MDVGVTIPHTGRYASPDWVREYCTTAEQLGFDSLWGVDHLVMPQHTESDYTLGRKPSKIADDAVSGLLSPNYEMPPGWRRCPASLPARCAARPSR